MAIDPNAVNYNYAPPRCKKHNQQMILSFLYSDRMQNSWICRGCIEDDTSQQTRWPNAGEPGGAEL